MEIKYEFSPEEVIKDMQVVGETYKLGSRPTETGRGRRLFHTMIPDEYKETALKLVDRCKYAYSHGLRNNVTMTSEEIVALKLLVKYVMEVVR